MAVESKKYKAICFDLDGTLLGMDINEFMTAYFSRIAKWGAAHGLDPERFVDAIKVGTKAMAKSDDGNLNKDVFWDVFMDSYGKEDLEGIDVMAIADEFYEEDFNHIGDGFEADPLIAETVRNLEAKGYPLVLTTMPMFPLKAVKHRLSWAGVDPASFERITSYENSTATKPKLSYFAENLAAMGLKGEDVLMVGNNTVEDMSFLELGADGYLVTDWLLDPVGYDMSSIKHGSFREFADWVEGLDDCEDPATGIEPAAVDHALTMKLLEDESL